MTNRYCPSNRNWLSITKAIPPCIASFPFRESVRWGRSRCFHGSWTSLGSKLPTVWRTISAWRLAVATVARQRNVSVRSRRRVAVWHGASWIMRYFTSQENAMTWKNGTKISKPDVEQRRHESPWCANLQRLFGTFCVGTRRINFVMIRRWGRERRTIFGRRGRFWEAWATVIVPETKEKRPWIAGAKQGRDYRWSDYSLTSCTSAELVSASPDRNIIAQKQERQNTFWNKSKRLPSNRL